MFELLHQSDRHLGWPRKWYGAAEVFLDAFLFLFGVSRSRRWWAGRVACCLIGGVGLSLSSCRSKVETVDPIGESQRCVTEQMQLTVTTSSSQIKTSEMLVVSMQVRHDPRYRVEWPEMTGSWGGFVIFESHASASQLEPDGWVSERRELTLEPDLPGVAELPGLLLQANRIPVRIDTAQKQGGKADNNINSNERPELSRLQIYAEPMTVQVVSVLGQADQQIRDIASDNLLKTETASTTWIWAWVIGNLSVGLVFLALGWYWRKNNQGDDCLIRAQSMDQWQLLTNLDASEMMKQMEPRFVLLMEQLHGVKPCPRDFDGLLSFLNEESCPPGIDLDQLQSVVFDFQHHYYRAGQPRDTEVQKLHRKLTGFLTGQDGGKGVTP